MKRAYASMRTTVESIKSRIDPFRRALSWGDPLPHRMERREAKSMIKRIEPDSIEARQEQPKINYTPPERPRWGERLVRNLSLAAMLVITIAAIRNAELPSGKTVLAAVQGMIAGDWDSNLGKISFVGRFLPETVAVFFEPAPNAELTAPCFGALTHEWTEREPYLGYESEDKRVFAVAAGQVMSVSRGPDQEYVLRLRHDDGLESLYYNLASAAAAEGDLATPATCLGEALPGGCLIEVRRAGRAIDPSGLIAPREGNDT